MCSKLVRLREFGATDTTVTSTFVHFVEMTQVKDQYLLWFYELTDNINNLLIFFFISNDYQFSISYQMYCIHLNKKMHAFFVTSWDIKFANIAGEKMHNPLPRVSHFSALIIA